MSDNYCNLISYNDYINYYYIFHEKLSSYYGENSIEIFNYNLDKMKDFLSCIDNKTLKIKVDLGKDKKNELIKSLNVFKNEEKDKSIYLKRVIGKHTDEKNSFYQDLNFWLRQLDALVYDNISFFASNLIYCLNEYGKLKYKGINQDIILYRGNRLKYKDILLYEKYFNEIITFPFFVSTSLSKEIAEEFSEKDLYTNEERKNREEYSVLFDIIIKKDINCFPVAIDIQEISKYKNEKEFVIVPFTFFRIIDIIKDLDCFIVYITLEVINKIDILEKYIKNKKKLKYNNTKNIIEIS